MMDSRVLITRLPRYEDRDVAWAKFGSRDAEQVRSTVGTLFGEHHFRVQRCGSELDYSHRTLAGTSTTLVHMHYGSGVRVQSEGLGDFLLNPIPVSGCISFRSGSRSGVADRNRAYLPVPDAAYSFNWSADCEALILRLERGALQRCLGRLLGREPRQRLEFQIDMELGAGDAGLWLGAVSDFVQHLQQLDVAPMARLLLPEREEMLMATLLYAQPNNYSEALRARGALAPPQRIRRVEHFIQDNITQPLSPSVLAEVAQLSSFGLWRTFRRHLGCTPMQYVRDLRMHRAREELAHAARDATVTEIAAKWGFMHFGRFSMTYRQRFGELPSQTLQRGRRIRDA